MAERLAGGGDRREQILAGAGELFASKGVRATTVRDIGSAVGLLSGSLYYYFDSKEAIVEEIIARFNRDLSAAYGDIRAEGSDPRRGLAGLIRASFRVMAMHPYACRIYQHDIDYLRTLPWFAEHDATVRAGEQVWLAVLGEGVAGGQFRTDVDPVLLYRFVRASTFLAVRWYRPDGRYEIDELAESCIALFTEGYARDPAGV